MTAHRRWMAACCVGVALLANPTASQAQDAVIDVEVEDETENDSGATCEFRSDAVFSRQGSRTEGDMLYTYFGTNYFRFNQATGESWIRSNRSCSDGTGGLYWRVVTPRPEALIEPARDRATGLIRAPRFALNPPTRGYVNLGMWLAVESPAESPLSVRADAGTAWAEVTATLAGTTFDMGNGEREVECDGYGDPIPDDARDDIAPSPTCGYTYTNNDDQPYTVSATSTWTLIWRLSNGRSGTLPDLVLTGTLDYEVWEIQTVGERG